MAAADRLPILCGRGHQLPESGQLCRTCQAEAVAERWAVLSKGRWS